MKCMKKKFNFSSRKVFVPLFIIVCISVLCLSVYASTNSAYCDKYGHTINTILSHGSYGTKTEPTESYCWQQQHYQCVAECYFCGDTFMTNHVYNEQHDFVYKKGTTGYYWECSKCGYRK